MTQTTNYELNIVEGNDVVNPLVQTNPNFTKIDEVMKANEDKTVATVTEVKSGTNHAITRSNDANMFRFVATSDYRTGDTFSVDGVTVTASLSDGSIPKDRAFVIGTSVVCILDGTRLTLVNCDTANPVDAEDVVYDNSDSTLEATNVNSAIDELDAKKKNVQTPVTDPTIDGVANAFISTITQNTNGEISAEKKRIVEDYHIPVGDSVTIQIGGGKKYLLIATGFTACMVLGFTESSGTHHNYTVYNNPTTPITVVNSIAGQISIHNPTQFGQLHVYIMWLP